MTRQLFHVADCPPELTVARWLDQHTDFEALGASLHPSRALPTVFATAGLPVDVAAVEGAVREVFAEHGWHGWRHDQGASPAYGGFSLVHNPDRDPRRNVHADVMGTADVELGDFLWEADEVPGGKGTYADCYGFRERTPGSRRGALGELLDGFDRTIVRSGVRELHALYYLPELAAARPCHPHASAAGWHRDETVFENLRLLFPISSDPIFTIQIAENLQSSDLLFDGHLAPGRAYVWDTYLPHRAMVHERAEASRIHLVLGIAPWFDHLPEEDAWVANEYFGRIHPFDMLAEGLIHPAIRLADDHPSSRPLAA